ncbi:MAG: group II intron reverse transcriptase/maturase [Gammaproteobacteria bacterium]|nr:group II intron reverse transcriptase/maturase [Gammaproteobacteria bacterium]
MEFPEDSIVTEMKLKRIAALSAANPEMIFTHVIHHFNVESLRACFHELDGKKAIGSDGIDKASYGKNLEANLQDLMDRMKRMAYIPGPVREVLIPKEGKPGSTRPLGISNFEDKIVQRMMHKILESIYEPLFCENSYGFRPGKSCHDAIEALHAYLSTHEVEKVIDVDLSNYFGSISHHEVINIISKKISDPRLIRYLIRMFKSGVLTEGELIVSDEGVPQGSGCSPIIANIFAHEVIDEWLEKTVKAHCAGKVKMVRYADDIVICCQYSRDADRIKKALNNRLVKYGLKMNEDKTKLVKFSARNQRRGVTQETFDFLGFTFYFGKSQKGYFLVKVKTNGKRLRSKLKKVNEWARAIKNKIPLKQIMKIASAKARGHIQYYGVSHNIADVSTFIDKVEQILFKWMNRRSQRKSFTWEKFREFLGRINFPKAKICHKLF